LATLLLPDEHLCAPRVERSSLDMIPDRSRRADDGGQSQGHGESTRERLRRLVDQLPDSELNAAERFLQFVDLHGDPFLIALKNAPSDDEPLNAGDREALAEGRRALAEGDTLSDEELRAELGI
jgi:hypothetical protein